MLTERDYDASLPRLAEQLAQSTGSPAADQEFVSAVASAFVVAQAKPAAQMFAACRGSRCHPDFAGVLRDAASLVPQGGRILALGAGNGWAARSSEFAFRVCEETLPAGRFELHSLDLTPAILHGGLGQSKFDLVVSHSLLHFIFDLDIVLAFVAKLINPAGAYVAAHEPNSRFTSNSDCRRSAERFEQTKRRSLRRRLHPKRIADWVASRFNHKPELAARVNGLLKQRHGWPANYSFAEIAAIIDPHFPPHSPGLNWAHIERAYLPEFEVRRVVTCGHLGRSAPARLPDAWKREEEQLRERFPLDGSMFTAWWARRPSLRSQLG